MRLRIPKGKDGHRRYGRWAGNPDGHKEDATLCIVEVSDSVGWGSRQCARRHGHGPGGKYCKQHAKKVDPR